MHVGRKAQKREKKAMSVSLYGNLFFVIVEIVMAIYTSSQAVLLDAVYDGVEQQNVLHQAVFRAQDKDQKKMKLAPFFRECPGKGRLI